MGRNRAKGKSEKAKVPEVLEPEVLEPEVVEPEKSDLSFLDLEEPKVMYEFTAFGQKFKCECVRVQGGQILLQVNAALQQWFLLSDVKRV